MSKDCEPQATKGLRDAIPTEYQACRESGRSVLLARVRRMRQEADYLEALAQAIPDNFPRDADEGLWHLASNMRW